MIELTTALTAARALADLAQAALDARDDAKAKAAIAELQSKVYDATSAAMTSIEKAAALQAALHLAQSEKAEIEAKFKERAMYALHELVPGSFVYASKPAHEGENTPLHYLCQPCYDKGVKSILRRVVSMYGPVMHCPEVGAHELPAPASANDYDQQEREAPHVTPPPFLSAWAWGRNRHQLHRVTGHAKRQTTHRPVLVHGRAIRRGQGPDGRRTPLAQPLRPLAGGRRTAGRAGSPQRRFDSQSDV